MACGTYIPNTGLNSSRHWSDENKGPTNDEIRFERRYLPPIQNSIRFSSLKTNETDDCSSDDVETTTTRNYGDTTKLKAACNSTTKPERRPTPNNDARRNSVEPPTKPTSNDSSGQFTLAYDTDLTVYSHSNYPHGYPLLDYLSLSTNWTL
ncbi:hypothetical protein BCR33DRAFT_716111 [Rhizoclosmatium globosum]|uniref:Uncharacterized protein n=1 Tax=Rhizoclosmatium globosum TaxID=329046 RepID=A0A1Y2CGG2_9FUNG|nr:hypothetical protein BCR33DRAFT_716111 [Rhizoclosmatium globosum]|eukprot:ORY46109.1 hypothetical protein BCR33DRAFT_716111 [Rhizoclosmatium globosum]